MLLQTSSESLLASMSINPFANSVQYLMINPTSMNRESASSLTPKTHPNRQALSKRTKNLATPPIFFLWADGFAAIGSGRIGSTFWTFSAYWGRAKFSTATQVNRALLNGTQIWSRHCSRPFSTQGSAPLLTWCEIAKRRRMFSSAVVKTFDAKRCWPNNCVRLNNCNDARG